jgi:hypothetical protein
MYDLIETECVIKYQLYRADQAEQIAKSALEIESKSIRQTQAKLPTEFKEFAKGLCEMPVDIWKSKSIPKNCESLVAGSLPFDEGDIDPCPEQQEGSDN